MPKKFKNLFFMILIGLSCIFVIEVSAFLFLKVYYHYRIKKSGYSKLFHDIELYLDFRRFHPLFADNSDLCARSPDLDFDPIVGYKFVPNTIQAKPPAAGHAGHIEIDSTGFPHNGVYNRNEKLFAKPPEKVYRVVFFGGSTTVGRGATDNSYTIPAYFEQFLKEIWKNVDFQVINAGNWGYQSTQERLYYSFYIKQLHPDLLIFIDGDNDSFCSGSQRKWTPYFQSMAFSNAKYRNLFRPKHAFANYIQSLRTFPQPFYSLFFIDKLLYKLEDKKRFVQRPGKGIFIFYDEAVAQFKDNLLATAREISSENSLAIFCLQPILGISKDSRTGSEEAIFKRAEWFYPDFRTTLKKYFSAFFRIYAELKIEFTDEERIDFTDISDIFEENERDIYISLWHYNDYGNKIIAEKLFNYGKEKIKKSLVQKGLLNVEK